MKNPLLNIFSAVAFIALAGCSTYVPVAGGDNLAYLYGKGAAAIRLDARVYEPAADRTTLYFKLRTADLLYKGTGGGGPYHARVMMRYEAWPANGQGALLDSASTLVKDQRADQNEDRELIGSMAVNVAGDQPYLLRITAHDLNRDAESTVLARVERGAGKHRDEFMPIAANGLPYFDDRVQPGAVTNIRTDLFTDQILFAAHYPASQKLPAPVFAEVAPVELGTTPDSTFMVHVGGDGTFQLKTGSSGYYLFRPDTASMAGYALFIADGSYPLINTAPDMAGPLRYITSLKEWDAISAAKDQRKEVEKFWINAAGSRDRAREAISGYYGRVETANRHFTSCLEGWKTDRGLVHIIFGTPTSIRRSADGSSETWTYGEETNLMSLNFEFVRKESPFCGNDMVLQRNQGLKSAWYRNVESWRNGRILQN